MKSFFALIFYTLNVYLAFGQQYRLSGKVTETFSKVPIPFAHIVINGKNDVFTDLEGKFDFKADEEIFKVDCKYPMHRSFSTSFIEADTLNIKMTRFEFFKDEMQTSPSAYNIMKDVLLWTSHNNPDFYTYYTYYTYNKFTITPGSTEDANKMVRSFSRLFPGKFKELNNDQHLLIVESASEKLYLNHYNHKETFKSTRSSGISVPSVFYKTSQLQASNIYSNYIILNGKEYLSPLSTKSVDQYNFILIDSAIVDQRKLYILKFNPKPEKNFDGLRGQMYIDEKNHAVRYYSISPMDDNSMSSTIYQEFQLVDDLQWFPKESKTEHLTYKGIYEVKYSSKLISKVYNIKRNIPHSKGKFDEVILELPTSSLENQYFDRKDRAELSSTDSNTYAYYESVDKKHNVQKFLFLGERLHSGYLPLGMVDIDVNRIITFNEIEGGRIGLGFHTNKKFSQRIRLGLFAGYGLKDERLKYGIDWNYKLPVTLAEYRGYLSHDLQEAGAVFFMFDRYQYPTETLRRFRLKILDMVTGTGHGIYLHPFKNLDIGGEINFSVHQPTYSYSYNNVGDKSSFKFTELREGLRYAIRERYYKMEDRKTSLGTSYPIFYLQLVQSLGGVIGRHSYQKLDLKIEENLKILRLGVSKLQFIAGYTSGNAPYMKLYNEKGSRKGTYFLIHNSFETMGYNEFLSDRYYSLFYTHSFGRIYYGHPNIQPAISMMHNAGVGWLNSSALHTDLPFTFKTMEKGYFESGAMVENILVIGLSGLKTGLGIGFYYRYGPYSSLKGSENLVLKFALNFGI